MHKQEDVYSIHEGRLYHICESKNLVSGIPQIPIMVAFSDESKEVLKVCPVCYKTLDWNTITSDL